MAGRWIMRQTWRDLLFAHWPVPAEALRPAVPAVLPIDVREGTAWIGVTPFEVTGLRGRWMPPIPGLSRFAEVNVRTYVDLGGKPGIWFLSLDAANRAAVAAARRGYRLPYFHAAMQIERDGGHVRFESRRRDGPSAEVGMRYTPGEPAGDELGRWLTERYCLYAVDHGELQRADIQHPPWPLQEAEAQIEANSMPPREMTLEGSALFHFSRRQDVLIWPLQAL
jgi:uncharacterized protein